jgi:two-component system, cell cycle response regulator
VGEVAKSRLRATQVVLIGLGVVGLGVYAVRLLDVGGPGFVELADVWVYNGIIFLAAAACLLRAVHSPGTRAAWCAFGVGLLAWAFGDVYWTLALADVKRTPYPSLADAGYLLALPCFFVGIALLTKRSVGRFGAASWLDGAIGGLAAAAAGAAVIAPALVGATKGDPAAVLTNLAYPLGDVLLIAFIVTALLVVGVRNAGSFVLIGAGLAVWTFGDGIYLVQEATGSYEVGWLDLTWIAGALLIGAASCAGVRRRHSASQRRSSFALPSAFAIVALGLLTLDHFDPISEPALFLAVATLLAVIVRLGLSFRENDALVRHLREDAITDALTGLGNRRKLFEQLEAALHESRGRRRVLAILDLDGFKHYNDTFGHPAGDALLRRLGQRLQVAVAGHGEAFRLGGDEFCVLADANEATAEGIVTASRDALTEQGEGFKIGASCGAILLPETPMDASDAMRMADQTMYAEKAGRKGRLEHQTREVLLRILRDREPELSEHGRGVARLARSLGRALELDAEAMDVLVRSAELHDVGKIAIPEDILHKRGPLDEVEWALMRKHTLIGERILGAAPAMAPVATVVRSSHERWDGGGYPDRLAGADIPLAARIVSICDAYEAMTSVRPYRKPISKQEALDELRRCAGSQFDPTLVELFCAVESGEVRPAGEPVPGPA